MYVVLFSVTMATDCNTLRSMARNIFTQYHNQYIGSYGDSNPEDLSEWVNVIGYESLPNVVGSCDPLTGSCDHYRYPILIHHVLL